MSEYEFLSEKVVFSLAQWNDPDDCDAVVHLLDDYARDPMGGGAALSNYARENLPQTLASIQGAFSVIGRLTDKPVALANCFTALSTFACKPLVNIHDLTVVFDARGRGVGQRLLSFVEAEARRRGCCKVTLEVLTGNHQARRSYERFGFTAYTLDESTGHAVILQKTL
jgi:GNAT superfamily N-acetyltransferase